MGYILEKERKTVILADVDVIVVGGGSSGLAAAVTASRNGCSVVLIERYGFLGGMTTAGLSGTVGGLYNSSVKQKLIPIVRGFAGEFVELLRSRGGATEPFPFGHTALVVHDPFVWKKTADELIKDAKVRVLYHTIVVDVIAEGPNVQGVIIENKDGRAALLGKVILDCSGDGDVCYLAGAEYRMGREGFIQYPSMMFRMSGVNTEMVLDLSMEEIEAKVDEARASGDYDLPRRHIFLFPTPNIGEFLCNVTQVRKPDGGIIDSTKTEDLTYAEFRGRELVKEYERFLRNFVPGFEKAYVSDTGVQIGIRQSRSIIGKSELKNEDVEHKRKFNTAITRSAWPMEVHGKEVKILHIDDDFYEIPFECLIPRNLQNVLMAGRCMSAEHEALASARVTAQCFEMGFAAGVAASISVQQGLPVSEVDGVEVKRLMIKQGAALD